MVSVRVLVSEDLGLMSEEGQTLTVAEAAQYFGRTQRTIQRWCVTGTLIAFNYRVIRDKSTRWLIVIPSN